MVHTPVFMVQVSGPFIVVLMTVTSITLLWSPLSDEQREYSYVHTCIHVYVYISDNWNLSISYGDRFQSIHNSLRVVLTCKCFH